MLIAKRAEKARKREALTLLAARKVRSVGVRVSNSRERHLNPPLPLGRLSTYDTTDAHGVLIEAVADLSTLSDEALWAVAQEQMPSRQWRRHQRLLRKAQEGVLTETEKIELEALRADTDRSVIRRSYALALLKWRGHTLP